MKRAATAVAAPLVSERPAPAVNVVALAASAGGVVALRAVLAGLPADFPAAILIVQHLVPQHPSHLVEILARHTRLDVKQAATGDCIRAGAVYVAPPDHHLLLGREGELALSDAARVNFSRPAADVLFESVAHYTNGRTVAVVLSGLGHDGASGAEAIKAAGGVVIAQDEASSAFFAMPSAAIQTGSVDLVLPLDQIGPTLIAWASKGPQR